MIRTAYLLFLTFLIGFSISVLEMEGQTTNTKRKDFGNIEQIQKSIDQTNQLLNGSKQEKEQLLKRLDLLQSQISYRKELQEKLSNELHQTDAEIQQLKKENSSSIEHVQILQKEYTQLLKNKLIHRLTYNPMLTLLHPGQLDENVKHWYLLERMEKERQQTLNHIHETKLNYNQTLESLTRESFKKDSLLKSVNKESERTLSDIAKSKEMIQDLNSKESGLNAALIAYKKKKDELNRVIEESMKSISKTKEHVKSGELKKDLKYPMNNATIISRFGKNMEGGKSKLLMRNNGIDLQSSDPFVKVSANSEVVEIRKMPNQSYLLITKSGNLFVAYSNLENILLRNGEKVEAGVNLGKASKNSEGYYELHFETWIEKTPMDPLKFLQ